MQALLVNARGTILWRGARRYSSETSQQIIKDLLSEIRLARTRGTRH